MLILAKMFEGNYTKMGFTNHRNKSFIIGRNVRLKLAKKQPFKD